MSPWGRTALPIRSGRVADQQPAPALFGCESQALPHASPSLFCWLLLRTFGQLSQASPRWSSSLPPSLWLPSPSSSFAWSTFETAGQLSQALPIVSPSESFWSKLASDGQLSQ